MNITFLGPAYPYRGGIAAFNNRLAQELIAEGHNVKIETFTVQYPNFLFPGKSQFSDDEAPKDLDITRSVNSVNPLNWLKVGNKIKNDEPDILIVRYWMPFMAPSLGKISRIVKKNNKTKIIAIVDNFIPHEKRIGDQTLSKYFTNSVDAFITMSKAVLNDISKINSTKIIRFTPHPIYDIYGKLFEKSTAIEKLNLSNKNKYILFFGLIRDYKGLDLLLDAMKNEEIKQLGIKLIVAGEFYSNEEKYLAQIKENNIEDNVILVSKFIPDNEVGLYFSASDLIVQPYKTATQSGVTQIAYHFNKPMLVTNVGGLPEIVPNNKCGYVVNKSANEISNSIIDFYINNKEKHFAPFIEKEKEKYEWNKLTATIFNIFNELNK